ncbi:PREDICTED: uncharacterized protein LOC106122270 isoform X2 [Papilio xuthus]|uniref:Uncharacterized protein LOC106122270 isoform X2 n=1 Tax=Papilio xuthus TaxID=66420 RepID=A0AAJ6ZJ74_PAPXU|nr:PREDICTED: uncharacterized protein LOC106122270 isoform X2 [Papilio xuthus]
MLVQSIRLLLLSLSVFYNVKCSSAQFQYNFTNIYAPTPAPLPFPKCVAADIPCLRRGLRTFFFLMEAGHMGMKPVDPAIINSVVVAMPEQGVSILLRNINVTGAKWTKLADRILNPFGTKSSVKFLSDLHVTGELTMSMAQLTTPFIATITMDMQEVESNITYTLSGQSNFNNDDYFIIGPERIAVRNSRIPTFFLQPDTEDTRIIELVLQTNQSILDHLANEVVVALMRNVVDNFRIFSSRVPIKHYYQYMQTNL